MTGLDFTIALERYDRHVPFFMGAVAPPVDAPESFRLTPLEVGMSPPRRDGVDRHRRFLRGNEFDIAETSLSSHVVAMSRGEPFVGVPVFPRRLFSQNHILVNAAAGIDTPQDLAGKRVIIQSFQVTMSVLAIGDLQHEYGLDPASVRWMLASEEALPPGRARAYPCESLPPGTDVGRLLVEGEADAMIFPHPPASVLARPDRVRPLFADRRAEALRYYRRHGWYPIMHLIAIRRPLAEAHPWLPRALAAMWEDAKRQAHGFYEDPGYAALAFARNELEAQEAEMGADPWPTGLAANRANLERFIGYMAEQRLIDAPVPVEALFDESMRES